MTQYITVDIFSTRGHFNPCGVKGSRVAVPCKDGNLTLDMIAKTNTVVLDHIEQERKQVGFYGSIQSRFQIQGERRQLAFGGRFIWSNDSRYRKQYGDLPIPLHDNYVS